MEKKKKKRKKSENAFPDLFSSGKRAKEKGRRKPRSTVHLCLKSVLVLALRPPPPLESSGFRGCNLAPSTCSIVLLNKLAVRQIGLNCACVCVCVSLLFTHPFNKVSALHTSIKRTSSSSRDKNLFQIQASIRKRFFQRYYPRFEVEKKKKERKEGTRPNSW